MNFKCLQKLSVLQNGKKFNFTIDIRKRALICTSTLISYTYLYCLTLFPCYNFIINAGVMTALLHLSSKVSDRARFVKLEYVPVASYSVIQISARRNETGGRIMLPHTFAVSKHTG